MNPAIALACCGSCSTSCPPRITCPELALKIPIITRIVVVLPAPLGPRKPKISPGATSMFRLSTAASRPYCLRKLIMRIMAELIYSTAMSPVNGRRIDGLRIVLARHCLVESSQSMKLLLFENFYFQVTDQLQNIDLPVDFAFHKLDVGHIGGKLIKHGV